MAASFAGLAGLVSTVQNVATIAGALSGGSKSGPGTPQRAANEAAFYAKVRKDFARGRPASAVAGYVAAMNNDCSQHRDVASCTRLQQIAAQARADGEADYRASLYYPTTGNLTSSPLRASQTSVISGVPAGQQPVNAVAPASPVLLLLLLLLSRLLGGLQ